MPFIRVNWPWAVSSVAYEARSKVNEPYMFEEWMNEYRNPMSVSIHWLSPLIKMLTTLLNIHWACIMCKALGIQHWTRGRTYSCPRWVYVLDTRRQRYTQISKIISYSDVMTTIKQGVDNIEQGSANYSRWVASSQPPVFVVKRYWSTTIPTCLHIV